MKDKLITHEDYEGRFAAIKEAIATDTYLLQQNLPDYIVYLERKAKELKQLKECLVLSENTLLKSCISEKIFLVIKMNAGAFKHKDIERLTLKDISQVKLFDLWKFKGITSHQIHTIRQVLQKLNLKFAK